MPELIDNRKVFSLLEVSLSIQKTLAERYTSVFWVKAEMNKLNHYAHSGHCYPELLEKRDGKVVAEISGTLWKDDYLLINERFLQVVGEPLKDGITMLFAATIGYHPVYGLSLRVVDIDPGFSLGELEREKRETINRLRKEGIFQRNRQLPFPLLPQRIAVISVETSKGFADYLNVLNGNPWGYKFSNFLFPALLQGDRSVGSILHQLRQIKKVVHHFDIVAIIRGGGGDVGMSSYNVYELAHEIALFPIPVLTGIGHSTNETVSEMVAYKNGITPTEIADFLLQRFHDFSVPVQRAQEVIAGEARRLLDDAHADFRAQVRYFRSMATNLVARSGRELRQSRISLGQFSVFLFKQQRGLMTAEQQRLDRGATARVKLQRLELTNVERRIQSLDPVNVLKRGFTITLHDGKAIKSLKEVKPGDTLTTITVDGRVTSRAVETHEPDPS
jgi:exodeoxyribonuclease VII large subunit